MTTVSRVSRSASRPEQDLARLGRLLQPCRRVDRQRRWRTWSRSRPTTISPDSTPIRTSRPSSSTASIDRRAPPARPARDRPRARRARRRPPSQRRRRISRTIPPCATMQCSTWSKNPFSRERTTSGSALATSSRRADEIDEKHRCQLPFHPCRIGVRAQDSRSLRRRQHTMGPCSTRRSSRRTTSAACTGSELDEEGAYAIGRAYVEHFEPRAIAVGRDMRVSAPDDGGRGDGRRRRRRRGRASTSAWSARRWSTSPSASSGSRAASASPPRTTRRSTRA